MDRLYCIMSFELNGGKRKCTKNFEVEQNSVTTDKVMSRHCLNFVATMVLFVTTKKNIKPHLSGRNLCGDMFSFSRDNNTDEPRKNMSRHDFTMSRHKSTEA